MEQSILGHVREDDVPGFEIPARYFDFVRSGDARGLQGVLEHNRLDLLALAMLTARAGQLLEEGPPATRSAREALGLGCLYERRGFTSEARACFARAIDLEADVLTHVEALRAYAVLCRRERRYTDAADAWRRMLAMRGCPARLAHEATEALAVHHEHRSRDLSAARQFAVQSLQFNVSRSRVQAVHHRLARIDRKIGGPSPQAAPLF
jgi:tetratricopeptide (TPR) repeat protein